MPNWMIIGLFVIWVVVIVTAAYLDIRDIFKDDQ